MIVAVLVFLGGSGIYRFKVPHGSPLTTIAQVAVAAARKSMIGNTDGSLYEGPIHGRGSVEKLCHTDQFL